MAFFEPLGDGVYRSTASTVGPWDPGLQHGSPTSALLTRELLSVARRADTRLVRVTVDILGPVPVADLTVTSRVARPGRRVELVEATASVDGREVVRASGWRIAVGPDQAVALPDPRPAPSFPDRETDFVFDEAGTTFGYAQAGEWRFATGAPDAAGPAAAWHRLRGEVVAGEEPSGWERVMSVADSGNGVSAVLPLSDWYFINPDLTVYLVREPVGEWVCLDAETHVEADGIGLAESALWDRSGRIGRGHQSLLVARR